GRRGGGVGRRSRAWRESSAGGSGGEVTSSAMRAAIGYLVVSTTGGLLNGTATVTSCEPLVVWIPASGYSRVPYFGLMSTPYRFAASTSWSRATSAGPTDCWTSACFTVAKSAVTPWSRSRW